MRRASIAKLKAHLSEYIDVVKAGEEVIVTDRNRPVAKLGPVSAEARGEARAMALVRGGLAKPPIRPLPKDFWKWPRPRDPEGRAIAAIIEEREEGR
jgi:prevent-host-death family protein